MSTFSIRAATEVLTRPEFPREAAAIRRDGREMHPIHAIIHLLVLQGLDTEPVNTSIFGKFLSFFSDHIRHKASRVFNRQPWLRSVYNAQP